MADDKRDEGIRMVSVLEIQRSIPESGFRDRLIELAAEEKISAYVAVPPGKDVYSDSLGVDTSRKGSLRGSLSAADTLAITRDRIRNVTVVAHPIVRRDVMFLRLSPTDVGSVAAKGHADVHWFTGALARHPDELLARRGYVVYPRGLLSDFCLRPLEMRDWRYMKPLRLDPENISRFSFADLYLTVADATYFQPSRAYLRDADSASVPFKELTQGVRLLCLAARHFYDHAPYRDTPRHDQIAQWLREHSPDGGAATSQSASRALFNLSTSEHLASFVNPHHKRSKGRRSSVNLNQEAIDEVRKRYGHEFISDPLLVVIRLDEWWQANVKPGSEPLGMIAKMDTEMNSLGLIGIDERKAIARLFYWPKSLPNHEWRGIQPRSA